MMDENSLRNALLGFGGTAVEEIGDDFGVTGAAKLFESHQIELVPGEEIDTCFANVQALVNWRLDLTPFVGYALDEDGVWRIHSWGVDCLGGIIETTYRRRLYYGHPWSPELRDTDWVAWEKSNGRLST